MENTSPENTSTNPAAGMSNGLQTLSAEIFAGNALTGGILTAPRTRLLESVLKVEINPVLLRNERKYQFAYHHQRKVTHRNLSEPEAQAELVTLLTTQFKQGLFHTENGDIHLLLNKRNEVAVRREEKEKRRKGEKEREEGKREYGNREGNQSTIHNPQSAISELSTLNPGVHPQGRTQPSTLAHDRIKNHILPEGQPVPFLTALGVMSADGRVVAAKRDKFRQINRFLEMVADVSDPLLERVRQSPERPLQIVDFGCGKGYLTFALYHYLHTLRGLNIELIGVDIKRDVLAQLTNIAAELNYTGLSFVVSDIQGYEREKGTEKIRDTRYETREGADLSFIPHPSSLPATIDLVVALHACDTATDDALAKAIAWNAQVILAAPCCQHELFSKIHNDALQPMLRHGIIRERLTALITDTLRAELLASRGYHVQLLEFVDIEHTPKNLLIRAVRRADGENEAANAARQQAAQETYERFREFWRVQPYMEQAVRQIMSNENI